MSRETELGQSKEDYLEAILAVTQENGACRMTDVARHLNYSKPSVSNAMKKLEEEGYVKRDDWRLLLTEEGYRIAAGTLEKHEFFRKALISIGVDPETAAHEACQIEHVISHDSFEKIKKAHAAAVAAVENDRSTQA